MTTMVTQMCLIVTLCYMACLV